MTGRQQHELRSGRKLRWPRRIAIALLAFTLAACESSPGVPWEHRFAALGTEFRIVIPRAESRDPAALFASVTSRVQALARDFDPAGNGELAALNAALAQGLTAQVSDELAALLRRAQTLSAASDGLFDPGIGALLDLWRPYAAGTGPAPSAQAIASVLAGCIGIRHLQIRDREVSSRCAGPALDLGAIAVGHAADQIVVWLRNARITQARIDADGDVRTMGRNSRQPWQVEISAGNPAESLGVVALATGEGLFTAALGAIAGTALWIDPRTGMPVNHTARVTVLAGQGVGASSAAAALQIAGPDAWRHIATQLGVRSVLREDRDGHYELTTSFARRLEAPDPG